MQAALANALSEESDRFVRNGTTLRQELRGAGVREYLYVALFGAVGLRAEVALSLVLLSQGDTAGAVAAIERALPDAPEPLRARLLDRRRAARDALADEASAPVH